MRIQLSKDTTPLKSSLVSVTNSVKEFFWMKKLQCNDRKKITKQGDPSSEALMENCCRDDQGVSTNYSRAAEWYQKSAVQGHGTAQYNLAILYKEVKGVPQDPKQSLEWCDKVALQRHSGTQCELRCPYKHGWPVERNSQAANKWYKMAVDQGYENVKRSLDKLMSPRVNSFLSRETGKAASPKPHTSVSKLSE
jgi:TPR repeat protein